MSHFNGLEFYARFVPSQAVLLILFIVTCFGWQPLAFLPYEDLKTVQFTPLIIGIYYWANYRPTLCPAWICFAFGLGLDVVTGGILGLNAFVFTVIYAVVRSQRRYLMGQPHATFWAFFGLVSIGASIMEWIVWSIVTKQIATPYPLLLRAGLITLIFPVISYILFLTHKLLPASSERLKV